MVAHHAGTGLTAEAWPYFASFHEVDSCNPPILQGLLAASGWLAGDSRRRSSPGTLYLLVQQEHSKGRAQLPQIWVKSPLRGRE
jgi:hypothetical protein